MISRSWVEVDGRWLKHNIRVIERHLRASGAQIIPVLKANAYGHGLISVAKELHHLKLRHFAVANLQEASLLRKAELNQPILLFGALLHGEMSSAIHHDCTITVSSWKEARWLEEIARKHKHVAHIHLKIDTGMGRLGVWHEEADALLKRIQTLRHVKLTGVYTHFASADEDSEFTHLQWQRFVHFLKKHPAELSRWLVHAANSPACFRYPEMRANAVRLGRALFGIGMKQVTKFDLRRVVTWKSHVTYVRRVKAGRTISYGTAYRLPRAQVLATIPVGYADGYPRACSNRSHVLVHGVRCPVRGRVTMDQIVVDVTAAGKVRLGDEVVLLGVQREGEIGSEELAEWADTIAHDILTGIGTRVRRVYKNFHTH